MSLEEFLAKAVSLAKAQSSEKQCIFGRMHNNVQHSVTRPFSFNSDTLSLGKPEHLLLFEGGLWTENRNPFA